MTASIVSQQAGFAALASTAALWRVWRSPKERTRPETVNAITLTDILGGVFKSSVYGVLIALSGCLRGLQCANSSSAVGDAATSAVVTGIVAIVVACGSFAVVFYLLGI